MPNDEHFSVRLNPIDRASLALLSAHFRETPSETIRQLVRAAVASLQEKAGAADGAEMSSVSIQEPERTSP